MNRKLQLTVAGVLLLLAIVGVIVASVGYSTSWGIFVLFPYVMLPMTAAIFSTMSTGDGLSAWISFGCVFEAILWISTLAIPSILYRVDAINEYQLGWLLASDVLVFASFMSLALINGH
ncbi:Vacuolar protein sorting 55 [Plasmopara halstedii]|uniref:Vacuolar protein sorting 55 n=1 Tax=Plasmopara halstedii TaxID=4781 RepID=A0A0P1A4Y8_PLAHL|nr:Vacuolar protein sorting 55 [Plasmopara halstedii]CEG35598.1 Vacuolar protein sorting 55 [Plasmopara halstedii]|eukprot:XP_024571967.1 Vacuolar protein sorting 55 [Plasmopara halstedii]